MEVALLRAQDVSELAATLASVFTASGLYSRASLDLVDARGAAESSSPGHLIFPDGQNRGRGAGDLDNGQFDREEEVLWPDGCAAMYRKPMLDQIGGFDEDFFAYGDDAELGLRARLAHARFGRAQGGDAGVVQRTAHQLLVGEILVTLELGLAVLRQGRTRKTRLNYRLVNQSELFEVQDYFGSMPTFVLDRPVRVKRTNWIGITVPTWAPIFANNLTRSDWWRASRAKDSCEAPRSLRQFALTELRDVATFGCTYSGARLLYTVTYVPDPRPTVS